MDHKAQITSKRVKYDTRIDGLLNGAFGEDRTYIINDLKAGRAETWQFGECYAVIRKELIINCRPELVIVSLAGSGLKAACQTIYDNAKKWGYGSIRFHTQRPAIARIVRHLGFYEAERVYRSRLITNG